MSVLCCLRYCFWGLLSSWLWTAPGALLMESKWLLVRSTNVVCIKQCLYKYQCLCFIRYIYLKNNRARCHTLKTPTEGHFYPIFIYITFFFLYLPKKKWCSALQYSSRLVESVPVKLFGSSSWPHVEKFLISLFLVCCLAVHIPILSYWLHRKPVWGSTQSSYFKDRCSTASKKKKKRKMNHSRSPYKCLWGARLSFSRNKSTFKDTLFPEFAWEFFLGWQFKACVIHLQFLCNCIMKIIFIHLILFKTMRSNSSLLVHS